MSSATDIITAMSYSPLQQHALTRSWPNNTDLNNIMFMSFSIVAYGFLPVKTHRLVVMPDSIDKVAEVRSRLHYTRGGIYSDMAEVGVGATRFTISGTTGWDPVRIGGDLIIDGAAAIKDLEETILSYLDPGSVSFQIAAPTMFIPPDQLALTFFNTSVPASIEDPGGLCDYLIVPDGQTVRISQDKSKPFMWKYNFSFVGLEVLLNIAQNVVGIARMVGDGLPPEATMVMTSLASLTPGITF